VENKDNIQSKNNSCDKKIGTKEFRLKYINIRIIYKYTKVYIGHSSQSLYNPN